MYYQYILKNLIFIFFVLWGTGGLSGQEVGPDSLYYFSGYTVNAIDSSAIPNSHIINLSKGTGTVSSVDGSFALRVRDMDTLRFSCVGFQDYFLQINASLLRPDLIITLMRDTILMDELRVSPLPPRRFFKYVFLETRIPKKEEPELNLQFLLGRDPGYVPETGIRFTGPVQLLYNAFNKKARLDRKLRKNREKYSKYLEPEVGDSLVFPGKGE